MLLQILHVIINITNSFPDGWSCWLEDTKAKAMDMQQDT